MKWNSLTITGVILLVIGVLAILIGVVIREVNISNGVQQQWYVFGLIIGGMVVTISGAILFVVAYDIDVKKSKKRALYYQREMTPQIPNSNGVPYTKSQEWYGTRQSRPPNNPQMKNSKAVPHVSFDL